MRRNMMMMSVIACLGGVAGCGVLPASPNAPSGRGWAIRAQGYRDETDVFVGRVAYGNRTMTTTTTVMHSWEVRGTQNAPVTAVPSTLKPTLRLGRPVTEFSFNRALEGREADK